MELTEYDIKTFSNVQKLTIGKKYEIDPSRPDRQDLIESLKKFQECYGILIFDEDFSKFRISLRDNVVDSYISSNIGQNKGAESTISDEMSKVTREYNSHLISKEMASNYKSIPGECARLDICERIMSELNQKSADKTQAATKEQELLNKIKEWKNQ